MEYYISVKFSKSNKTYYFGTDDSTLKVGDFVVVDTVIGIEMGEVEELPRLMSTLKFPLEIKPIVRKATLEDIKIFNYNATAAVSAAKVFEKDAARLNLNMNLISAQYTLDRIKILFTYVADERVDFRELLKNLANELHCRIELKQINARERAQLVGGIGTCGLPLCCTTFLNTFDGVSLNRAKNQMLTINIPKLSGQCGKLMCCLKFEDDLYIEEKKKYPSIGTKVMINSKEYKITSYNILTKVIRLDASDDVEFLSLEDVNKLIRKNNKNESK